MESTRAFLSEGTGVNGTDSLLSPGEVIPSLPWLFSNQEESKKLAGIEAMC